MADEDDAADACRAEDEDVLFSCHAGLRQWEMLWRITLGGGICGKKGLQGCTCVEMRT